ncbi:hypothetical protein Tco_0419367, partial [Tanacetum coccineum]
SMAPLGSSDDMAFDVHHNRFFFFLPLRLPKCNIEIGLKLIEIDSDLFAMYDYAGMYGILDMYVAHIPQKLEDFYFRNLCLDGSGDEVICDHFIGDSVEVEMHAPRVADKGKAKMLDDGLVVKHRKANVKNKGIVIEENKNPPFRNDTSMVYLDWPLIQENHLTAKWCKLEAHLMTLGFKFTLHRQEIGACAVTGLAASVLIILKVQFKYHVNIEQLMNPIPEKWSIRTSVWCICLGEGEHDAFVVINLSGNIVKYNLISKTYTEIFDIRYNQMDDDDDDLELVAPPFLDDPNLYEFIPSLASV